MTHVKSPLLIAHSGIPTTPQCGGRLSTKPLLLLWLPVAFTYYEQEVGSQLGQCRCQKGAGGGLES